MGEDFTMLCTMHIVEKEEDVLNSVNITLFSIHQEIDTENKIKDRDKSESEIHAAMPHEQAKKRENIS